MKKQRKASGLIQQDYFPLYFRGDAELFNYMQLRFQTTLNLQKQHMISLPLKTFNMEKQQFIEPVAQIQTFDQSQRQNLLKSKSTIKDSIFYIYFPSNIRVDQKIFKIYDKNYESFMKDVPKNYRLNFAKFIIWQQATGQQNINNQKQKLQQLLSNSIKITIQKKLQQFTKQIASLQALQLNQRVLRNLFVSRNKVASIYKQLKLTQNTCEHFSSLFNDILYNFKKFFGPSSSKQINIDKVLYKSPFIVRDINKIFGFFDSKSNFLHITNFCFIKMFESHLQLVQYFEGMKKFKQYIDFVLGNILNTVSSRQQDIARNMWIIETIDEGYKILRQKGSSTITNPQKQQQFSLINVSICSQYRNAIQRIGIIFYGLNTYIVFPRNLQYELKLCIKSMKGEVLTQEQYPQMKVVNRHQQVNKLLFLSGQPITQTIELILNNFQSYKLVYVRTLQLMQKTLSQSPYKKVSWSMKLSVLKATIIYFRLKDEKRMSITSLLQENKNFSYQSKKSVWQKLQIINKIYQLTLCKRYNIKMRVEDLLNIILDDSIIHLQKIWIQLVRIVSQLLFQYKRGQTEQQAQRLNCIDYGQGEDDQQGILNRKRRRTTIHYDSKKIQVGTIKFISLVDNVQMDQIYLTMDRKEKNKNEKDINNMYIESSRNNIIRLNIELSNRIISYALALIQKSKAQQYTQQNQQSKSQVSNSQFQNKQSANKQHPLIQLQFIIKTMNKQQKRIPFQIIQTEDKFIQVLIKSQQIIIFTIQKLLINITNSITLVYTMPINHQKIQFYDKKSYNLQHEQDYYVNISPELKINTLQLFAPLKVQSQAGKQVDKYRKQSTSSISSRQYSNNSIYGDNYLIYHKLWTPVKFMLSFNSNEQIVINKILIQCQDEIHDKIFIGEKQVNIKQFNSYKLDNISNQLSRLPLIIFVKPSQNSQKQKQPMYMTSIKRHKQSINILPKSLRNRAQSITRSVLSGSGSNMSIDSNRVLIKMQIKHNAYQYQVKKQISYSKKMPIKVDYRYSQQFQQYTVKNVSQEQLKINSQNQSFQLFPYQQLKVYNPIVKIYLKYQQQTDQSQQEQSTNLMSILKLDQKVDLKTMIKKQHLKPQKISTIWLSLQQNYTDKSKLIYKLFQPIRIYAQQCGYLSVLKWNSSEYQIVGKIQGVVEYQSTQQNSRTGQQINGKNEQNNKMEQSNKKEQSNRTQQQNKCLQVRMIPTKRGVISLPQISINSKKGIWKNGKRIKIQ